MANDGRSGPMPGAVPGTVGGAARARRHPVWGRPRRAARGLAAAVLLAACGGSDEPPRLLRQGTPPEPPSAASAAAARPPRDTIARVREVFAVQLGAFRDSGGAARLRDSLADLGWNAYVRSVGGDTVPWRVRVHPTVERAAVEMVLAGFSAARRPAALVTDAVLQGPERVLVHRVNRGAAGMRASVRWVVSPNRRALLVVEDAVAVESDPLPGGFLYVAERGPAERQPMVVQRDDVWDVAPNPEWTRVAYGRARLVSTGGRDSSSIRQWMTVAAEANLDIATVRRGAFPVSGMSNVMGFAQPVVEPLHPDSVESSALRRAVVTAVPVVGGWRVRWSADGTMLAVGLPPIRQVRDDSPPSDWLALDARSFLLRGAVPSYMQLATVPWVEGPVLEQPAPFEPAARRLEIEGGVVESRDGWISVRGPATNGRTRIVGPGVPLAATAGGFFVAAVVPVLDERGREVRVRTAIYELQR